MRSTHPIVRVVIDTSVHFGLPDMNTDKESKREEERKDHLPHATSETQEAHTSIRKPTQPRNTSFDRSDLRSRRAKSSIHARQQHTKPREEDPLDLSADEYKPWDTDGHTTLSREHEVLVPLSDLSNDTLSTESSWSPSSDAGISTIDKKKLQLHALRTSMRVRLACPMRSFG